MRHDTRWLGTVVLYVSMIFSAVGAAAQDQCSCVEHVATTQLYQGCRLSMGRNDFYPTARGCRGNDDAPDIESHPPITVDDATWREIPAGQDRCDPCEPERRDGDTVPRGDEDTVPASEAKPASATQ